MTPFLALLALGDPQAIAALPDGEAWPLEADQVVIERAGVRLQVRAIGLPKRIGIDPKFRTCVVSVRQEGGEVVQRRGADCHPNLADAVDAALAQWRFDRTGDAGRDRELFEYWYVFPTKRGDPVRLFLRQAWDADLQVLTPEIDVLQWGLRGRVLLEYPPEAVDQDTEITTCTVKVDIAPSGAPGVIEVQDCDPVFHASTEQALRRWRWVTPQLDGLPFWSGATLGVRYTRSVEAEGPPGRVDVLFPPDPDLGERTLDRLDQGVMPEEPEPLHPEPTWDPRLTLDHRSYAQVRVYDWRWPEPRALGREATCDVLFQVNSRRIVWAWAERCDPEVKEAVEAAANRWNLTPGRVERGEIYARFRGTFVFPADGGPVRMRLPEEDLVLPPASQLPDRFETYAPARAIRRVAPTLPRAFASEVLADEVVCELRVDIGRSGAPSGIEVESCPASYLPYAEAAVRRWRWSPAVAAGKPVPSTTRIRIRFEQPG